MSRCGKLLESVNLDESLNLATKTPDTEKEIVSMFDLDKGVSIMELPNLLNKNYGHCRGRFGSDQGNRKHHIVYEVDPTVSFPDRFSKDKKFPKDITLNLMESPTDRNAIPRVKKSVKINRAKLMRMAQSCDDFDTALATQNNTSGASFMMGDELCNKIFNTDYQS